MPASSLTRSRNTPSSASSPALGGRSQHLLAELLALNEEMILQLGLERQDGTGTVDFLTKMIEQHEKAATLIRAELAEIRSVKR